MNQARIRPLVVLAAASLTCWGAWAGVRLDDSASPRARVPAQVALTESGRLLADAPFADAAVIKFGRIDYRLATSAYVGRKARIYFVVPQFVAGLRSPSGLRVDWRGLGQLASGSGRAGERQLVWSGLVAGPWFEESLELTAWVDLKQLQLPYNTPFAFECFFEIETTP